ncbi:hypothetical protein GIB67_025044 [Kingdonia uniflora]|uniref:Trafficking protein particle complex II-specific subunit 130 homolog n=1 Tax=Kingdonia uniflora TaxID=39325 RepID=A0A7J7N840_9MAGN|nr:hypothetical protein GIB67_025044 [Kingdonia uniflora]
MLRCSKHLRVNNTCTLHWCLTSLIFHPNLHGFQLSVMANFLAQFQSIKNACDHLVVAVEDVSNLWHVVKRGFEERLPFKRACLNNKTRNLLYVEKLPAEFILTTDARLRSHFPQEQSIFWFREPYATVVLVTCEDLEEFNTILKPRLKLIVQNDEKEWFIVFVSKAHPSNNQATKCCKLDLHEPDSNFWDDLDSKIMESIRNTLDKCVQFYEDEIRKLSEQRFMPVWNFCNFFILKESLAFMFEMAHLHEDALREYDELELCYLETVFLTETFAEYHVTFSNLTRVNSTGFKKSDFGAVDQGDDQAALLNPGYKPLSQIVQDNDSFREFEFRQYLFACQSKLLFKQNRHLEVASRGYSFIISFSKALALHENTLPFCMREVWVITACLTLIDAIGTCCNDGILAPDVEKEFSRLRGNLYSLSRVKMILQSNPRTKHLGIQRKPLPLEPSVLLREANRRRASISAGNIFEMFDSRPSFTDGSSLDASLRMSPSSKVQVSSMLRTNSSPGNFESSLNRPMRISEIHVAAENALQRTISDPDLWRSLSSVENFEKKYLELTKGAADNYHHSWWKRHGVVLDGEIAAVYYRHRNYDLAAKSYEKVCALYAGEGWQDLLAEVLPNLAECQKILNDQAGYLSSCVRLLSLDKGLFLTKERQAFQLEVVRLAHSEMKHPVPLDVSSLITFSGNPGPPLELCDRDPGKLSFTVWSGFPDDITLESLSLTLIVTYSADEGVKVFKPRSLVDLTAAVSSALLMNEPQYCPGLKIEDTLGIEIENYNKVAESTNEFTQLPFKDGKIMLPDWTSEIASVLWFPVRAIDNRLTRGTSSGLEDCAVHFTDPFHVTTRVTNKCNEVVTVNPARHLKNRDIFTNSSTRLIELVTLAPLVILHSQVKATLTIYDAWLDLQLGFDHIGKGTGRPTPSFFPLVVSPSSRAGILFGISIGSGTTGDEVEALHKGSILNIRYGITGDRTIGAHTPVVMESTTSEVKEQEFLFRSSLVLQRPVLDPCLAVGFLPLPSGGLRVGHLVSMRWRVERLKDFDENISSPDNDEVLYEVDANQENWMIAGRKRGHVSLSIKQGSRIVISVICVPLVSGYVRPPELKLPNIERIKRLVRKIKEKGLLMNGLIKCFGGLGMVEELLWVWRGMKENGIEPSLFTYNFLLDGLVNSMFVESAERVFEVMQCGKVRPDVVSYNTMIKGYSKTGKLGKATEKLKEMEVMNVVSYNTMSLIQLCYSNSDINSYLGLFREMEEKGLEIPSHAYSLVISGLCKDGRCSEGYAVFDLMVRKGCKANVAIYTTLIDSFAKSGNIEEGMKLFERMKDEGFEPDEVTYGVIVNSLCKVGKLDNAMEYFEFCREKSFAIIAVFYSSLISGLGKVGRVDEAEKLFEEMEVKGCTRDSYCYNALIDAFAKCEKMDEALTLFERMEDEGCDQTVYTYTILINGLFKERKNEGALKLWEMMIDKGITPTPASFRALSTGLCLSGKVARACKILDELAPIGVISEAAFEDMINVLCKAGRFDQACNLADGIVDRGREIPGKVCTVLINALRKVGNADLAMKLMHSKIGIGYDRKGSVKKRVKFRILLDM